MKMYTVNRKQIDQNRIVFIEIKIIVKKKKKKEQKIEKKDILLRGYLIVN